MALVAPAPPELMFPADGVRLGVVEEIEILPSELEKRTVSLKAKRLKSPKSKLTRPGRRKRIPGRHRQNVQADRDSGRRADCIRVFQKDHVKRRAAFASAGDVC